MRSAVSLTLEDVEKIANLARLELTAEEKVLYLGQLSAVLDYAARLDELELADVPPTSAAVGLLNVWREDVVRPSLPLEDVLFNAPQQAQNQFAIQQVLED